MKTIGLFGAHDRYNYGDILFPLMIKYALREKFNIDVNFENFSMVKSNLIRNGGYKSKSYWALRRAINKGRCNDLIVTGGECLDFNWNELYTNINLLFFKLYKGQMKRILERLKFSKRLLGGKSDYPFCVNKRDFINDFKLIYNSVGGVVPFGYYQVGALNNADYVSLREIQSYNNSKILNKKSFLVPDSAIILSDVYNNEYFTNHFRITSELKEIIKEKYIYFQLSPYNVNVGQLNDIVNQLKSINKKYKLKILLCPIGLALRHEDNKVLSKIYDAMPENCIYLRNPKLLEICYLISNAQLFIGSSLHGSITAMSYNIPFIGLNKSQAKVTSYLDTWGIDELEVVEVSDFLNKFEEIFDKFEQLKEKIEINTINQKKLYYNSVEKIIEILNLK